MQWSDVWTPPTGQTLRQFSGAWLTVFLVLAVWQFMARGALVPALALGSVGVAVGAVGLIRPQAVRWIYTSSMLVSFPVGWLFSRILLGALYYFVLTPIALALRFVRGNGLGLRLDRDRASYWEPKPEATGPSDYFRQY